MAYDVDAGCSLWSVGSYVRPAIENFGWEWLMWWSKNHHGPIMLRMLPLPLCLLHFSHIFYFEVYDLCELSYRIWWTNGYQFRCITPSLHHNECHQHTFYSNNRKIWWSDFPVLKPSQQKCSYKSLQFNKKARLHHSGKFMRSARCLKKASSPSGFVRISASCLLDSVNWTLRTPRPTNSLIMWWRTSMFLVCS